MDLSRAKSQQRVAAAWCPVARLSDLPGPGPHAVAAGDIDLVVVRTTVGLRVYEGRCPHQGALLGEGELDGGDLVCRNHHWRFDAASGQRQGGAQCLVACPAREVDGHLEVDVSALGPSEAVTGAAPRAIDDLPGPRGLPLVGSAFTLEVPRMHRQLEDWAAAYGSPFAFRIGSRRVVVFADPEVAEVALRARPELFRRPSNLRPVFDEMGVSGVFSAEGAAWRSQRRLAMEALAQRHLRGFYPMLASVAERLRRRWMAAADAGRTVDMQDDLMRFTVDVTTNLAFGHDMNTLEQGDDVIQDRLALFFPTFQRRLNALVPYWRVVRMPSDRKVDRAIVELRTWLSGLIEVARTTLAADPARAERPANFLEAMLTARDETGQPFGDDIIFGNAMTMLLAGEDTTANTLAWAVHQLCDAPADVAALRAELTAAGIREVPTALEQASHLAVAGAIASETMRLRPVAPLLFVEPSSRTELGGVDLPAGTAAILLTRAPVLDERHFADPASFRPARWLGKPEGAHAAQTHIPFGSGPRICPGRSLALLEIKVVLATLYANFDVERVGAASDVSEEFAFTMAPRGLRVRLRPRAAG